MAATYEMSRALAESHAWSEVDPDPHVTISMGIDGNVTSADIRETLAAADARLYRAKETGRNRVIA